MLSKKKRYISICVVLCTVGLGILGWRLIVKQSRGSGKVLSSSDIAQRIKSDQESDAQVIALRSLNTNESPLLPTNNDVIKLRILQLQLPAGYSISPIIDNPHHETHMTAVTKRGGSRRLSIVIEERSDINELSAVQMRRRSPTLYSEEIVVVDGVSGIAFTSLTSEHYERVVFARYRGFIVSFAISTSFVSYQNLVDQDMGTVLESVSWLP